MTAPSGFSVRGTAAMQRKINRIAAEFPDRIVGAMRIESEFIMTRAKQAHVPVDLGNLRASGHIDSPRRTGRGGKDIEIRMSFGGPAAPYALAIHEHESPASPPSWRGKSVKFHPAGRGPKFLERPLMDAMRGMPERIAARVKV